MKWHSHSGFILIYASYWRSEIRIHIYCAFLYLQQRNVRKQSLWATIYRWIPSFCRLLRVGYLKKLPHIQTDSEVACCCLKISFISVAQRVCVLDGDLMSAMDCLHVALCEKAWHLKTIKQILVFTCVWFFRHTAWFFRSIPESCNGEQFLTSVRINDRWLAWDREWLSKQEWIGYCENTDPCALAQSVCVLFYSGKLQHDTFDIMPSTCMFTDSRALLLSHSFVIV